MDTDFKFGFDAELLDRLTAEHKAAHEAWMKDLGIAQPSPPQTTRQHPAKRPLCGAKTRAGGSCQAQVVPGRNRCRMHGGLTPRKERPQEELPADPDELDRLVIEALKKKLAAYEEKHGTVTPLKRGQGSGRSGERWAVAQIKGLLAQRGIPYP
jgi:hypothetical protein